MLTILNDIENEFDVDGLIAGDRVDLAATKKGKEQCVIIGKNIHNYIDKIDNFVTSPGVTINTLVHHIRVNSDYLTKLYIKCYNSFQERNFGILVGTKLDLNSDIFKHTRILPERGESVFQCKERLMNAVSDVCTDYGFLFDLPSKLPNVLVITRKFACQIMCNALLNVSYSNISDFWMNAGAMVQFDMSKGKDGFTKFVFNSARNLLNNEVYSLESICGQERKT